MLLQSQPLRQMTKQVYGVKPVSFALETEDRFAKTVH